MTIADVTFNTPCPGVRGGLLHYPRAVGGKPVSKPYSDKQAYGIQQHVMLSLCGDGYLVPPQAGETQHQLHARCLDLLGQLHASVDHKHHSAPVELPGSA